MSILLRMLRGAAVAVLGMAGFLFVMCIPIWIGADLASLLFGTPGARMLGCFIGAVAGLGAVIALPGERLCERVANWVVSGH